MIFIQEGIDGLHFIGEILFGYAMSHLGRMHYNKYGLMTRKVGKLQGS